ncbi:HDOD domain-containing protein [Hydrogenophaga sp. OTU3427]|uniref:HDOD domain-containing protein n=1 Tax=Hydrogenophaga sp. OTU3427 TaxID=3043856 RepID=UPI00313C70C2
MDPDEPLPPPVPTAAPDTLSDMTPATSASEADPRLPATLADLLRRMRHQTDFPAMSESIVRVQTLANSETESLNGLTNEILKDVALTQKLLRLVNSAQFAHAGGGISTVSRAVSLIGFAGIRNMALSLLLLEHMQDKAHAQQLRTEFLRALLAATLASDLCVKATDGEEAFIGGLFQNLGRMLAGFYLPEEARRVRDAVAAGTPETTAATQVLRLDYETLGLGVARAWGLPGPIQRLMSRPAGRPPAREPGDNADRLRWLVLGANDMADAVLASAPEVLPARLQRLAQTYSASMGVDAEHLVQRVHAARERLAQTADALGLVVPPQSPAARLMQVPTEIPADAASDAEPVDAIDSSLDSLALMAADDEGRSAASDPVVQASELLTTGIQDVTQALIDSVPLNDVLRMVLETMYRALGFRRVLLCLRDSTGQHMVGRMGLGEDAAVVARRFKIPLQGASDVFALVCTKNVDTLISDASAPNVAQRLPAWFREQVQAPSFLLLPLQLKGAPLGLIYADTATVGAIALNDQQLSLLKTLRNQAVMAFRQAR